MSSLAEGRRLLESGVVTSTKAGQGAGSSSSQEAQGQHGGQPRQVGEVQASLNYLERPGLRDKMKL